MEKDPVMLEAVIALISMIVSGLIAYLYGRRTEGKVRNAKEVKQRLDDMKTAKGVRDEVEALDDHSLAARASKWLRK